MFKNIVAPAQAWLLSQKRCVGCGTPLSQGTKSKNKSGDMIISCKCQRAYVYDADSKKYRRALLNEI